MKKLLKVWGLTTRKTSLVLCAFSLMSSMVRADVSPPVKITIPAERLVPAVSGQEYRGAIEIKVGADGQLADFQLLGEGWHIALLDAPDFVDVRANQTHLVEFRGTPTDASHPLHFSVAFDGRPVTKRIDLSSEYFHKASKRRTVVSVDAQGRMTPFQPVLSEASNVGGGQQLRLSGRIVYMRPSMVGGPQNLMVGADGVWFEVMDDDSPDFDETIYSGHTDPYGFFDVALEWDDCDISGCDEPDIYLRWETDTGVVNVQDSGILEEDYSWDTEETMIEDFEGVNVNFGTVMPGDWNEHAALHILTSITRAHRFILEHSGVNVEEVDAQWPESDSGAFYNPFFEEIHIGPDQQWVEGTHVHEFGHHYLENYALNLTPDYCNDFCDGGDGGCTAGTDCEDEGHCTWCRETNHDAWNEGFPNWLGSAVMRAYSTRYPAECSAGGVCIKGANDGVACVPGGAPACTALAALSINDNRYALEGLGTCCQDGQTHAADITEGFLTALLTDIEDAAQDDHSGGTYACGGAPGALDCTRDALNLGPEEILEVARLDQPTNPLAFIQAFRARFPQHDQDFWSTATNVAAAYSFTPPAPKILNQTNTCKMNIAGQPMTIDVQANGSALRYQWKRAGINVANGAQTSGAQCPTLSFAPLAAAHSGVYQAEVRTCDQSQTVLSDPIRVTVFPARGAGTRAAGFGRNFHGQLGNSIVGPTYNFPTATPLAGLPDVVQISAADFASVALRSDGTVWAWGIRRFGSNSGSVATVPEQVPGLTDVIQVAAGGMWPFGHNLALKADGTVWGWGTNGYGELGLGNFATPQQNPVQIPIDCVIAISAGGTFSLFLKSDGTVWSAGHNGYGQLGRSTGHVYVPEIGKVDFVISVTSISAGGNHAVGLRSDGTVYSWGRNSEGQLGRGLDFAWTNVPSLVANLSNVAFVATGWVHSIAILGDQTVRNWGANSEGQLGIASFANQNLPVQPTGLPTVRDAAGGAAHSVFAATDGTLWTVGSNHYGEGGHRLGAQLVPAQVAQIGGVLDVEAGYFETFLLNAGVPPSIILQPINKTVIVGQLVQFTIAALAVPAPHSYQWQRNGASLTDGGAISGALTPTLTIDPVTADMAGSYRLVLYNTFGSDVSVPATLTVTCPNGDGDCDGVIDPVDAAGLAECLDGPGRPRPPICEPAEFGNFDANNDGDVDLRDAAVVQRCFAGDDFINPACGQ